VSLPFAAKTSEDIEKMFAVNTLGPFYLSRSLARSWLDLPVSVGSGTVDVSELKGKKLDKQILFVSSISGLVAMSPQRQAAYNASKGGLTMLAKVSAGAPQLHRY
jgi:sorbose reductase